MKRFIYIIVFLFINFCAYSQIQYAVITGGNKNAPSPEIAGGKLVDICYTKNIAQISNALIKLKGEDWYINNILNNESSPRKIMYSLSCYVDTIVINNERLMHNNTELGNAMSNVCRHLHSQQSKIYIYLPQPSPPNKINRSEYLQLINTHIENMKSSQNDNNPAIYYFFGGFIGIIPGTTKFYYDKYYNKEIQNGNIPLSHIEWIKSLIDYYINLQIDSSLDYDIDNTAFQAKPTP